MKLVSVFAILVLVASAPYHSVCAQGGGMTGCFQCGGTPESPSCIMGMATGFQICWISQNACYTYGACMAGGGCFVAGTPVETPEGTVAIEDLHEGDRVLGRSADGEVVVNEVLELYRTLAVEYFVVNGEISVTGTHPFLVGNEWVEAQDLQVGDILVGSDGTPVPVNSVDSIDYGVRVFNITVSGNHTFFAGGLLVHNKGPTPGG